MAEHQGATDYQETRTKATTILRMWYDSFRELKSAIGEDDKIDKEAKTELILHNLAYSTEKDMLVAQPDSILDEVDSTQLLDLIGLAGRFDVSVEVEGFLVTSYILCMFVVAPSGKVTIEVQQEGDLDRAWSIIEYEYSMIGIIEIK